VRDVKIALKLPRGVPVKLVDARDYDSALSIVKLLVDMIEEKTGGVKAR